VIPAPFDYVRPATLDDAISALDGSNPGAAVLAGGQSLITDLKLRRKRARLVVDLAGLPGLDTIAVQPEAITFGAMARQAAIAAHPAVAERLPLLVQVAAAAADPMVRRRGTLVGACCEVAPSGDWLAAALALDGSIVAEGPHGRRALPLTEFVTGPAATALQPGEIACFLHLPTPKPGTTVAYRKFKHTSVGWSVASAAVVMDTVHDGHCDAVRIAVSGALEYPQRLHELEAALPGTDLTGHAEVDEVVNAALANLDYQGDYYASAVFRRKQLAVLLRRALMELGTITAARG
jgi:carbon-monoxide dehydrogenase medium subunit